MIEEEKNITTELALLGKAYYSVQKKENHEQDARGFNKALDAIWKEYERLTENG